MNTNKPSTRTNSINGMNSENSSMNSMHDGPPKEMLVQKLQLALQDLRRERDQEHRSKELATQRLRLAKEEERALSNHVQNLKAKREKLEAKCKQVQSRLGPIEAEVEASKQKMLFQHSELLSAREIIKQKQIEMQESAKARAQALQKAHQQLQNARNKLRDEQENPSSLSIAHQNEALLRELNACAHMDHGHFEQAFPLRQLMREKAVEDKKKAQMMHLENNQLEEELAKLTAAAGGIPRQT